MRGEDNLIKGAVPLSDSHGTHDICACKRVRWLYPISVDMSENGDIVTTFEQTYPFHPLFDVDLYIRLLQVTSNISSFTPRKYERRLSRFR